MIYANDLWVPLPTKDLYDTQLMLASISAAKDMYDNALKQMLDFNKTYGDFYSPIQKDMDRYNNTVIRPIQDFVNLLYASGIDPLRSQQGRSAINRMIASIPYGDINKMKMSAEAAKEYLSNIGKLLAEDKYSEDFENFALAQQGLSPLSDWDTIKNGQMWTRKSPVEYKTLNQATSHWFDDMQGFDKGRKNGYNYFGITDSDLMDVAEPHMLGLEHSLRGLFALNEIKKEILRLNPGISAGDLDSMAHKKLVEEVARANKERKFMKKEEDKFALENLKFAHDKAIKAMEQQNKDLRVPTIFEKAANLFYSNAKDSSYAGKHGNGTYLSSRYDVMQNPRLLFIKVKGSGWALSSSKDGWFYRNKANEPTLSYIRADRGSGNLRTAVRFYMKNNAGRKIINPEVQMFPTGEVYVQNTKGGGAEYRERYHVFVSGKIDTGQKYEDGSTVYETVFEPIYPNGKNESRRSSGVWNGPISQEDYNYTDKIQGNEAYNPSIR